MFLHLVSSVSLMVTWCFFKRICLVYVIHMTTNGHLGFANCCYSQSCNSLFLYVPLVCVHVCVCVCLCWGTYMYAFGGQRLTSLPQLLSTVLRQGLSLEPTGLWWSCSSCPACSRDTLTASWLWNYRHARYHSHLSLRWVLGMSPASGLPPELPL